MYHEIRQSLQQKQSISQSLQQSIQIMHLSSNELSHIIECELEKNPILSREEGDIIDKIDSQEDYQQEDYQIDDQCPDIYEYYGHVTKSHIPSSDNLEIENIESDGQTLKQYVMTQINVEIIKIKDKMTAIYLTDFLEETGYINNEYKSLTSILNCDIEYLDYILKILQKFDPPGIFARSLKECLEIQLITKGSLNNKKKMILDNLTLLGDMNLPKLKKICQVNDLELKNIIKEIRSLNPKPAIDFFKEQVSIIIPDVFIYKDGSLWRAKYNENVTPKILIDKNYYDNIKNNVKNKSNNKNDKKYLSEQYMNANWLVKAVRHRIETILSVTKLIIAKQKDFFELGINYLKPMNLEEIAEEINVHKSTVSRITNQKYISTPYGVLEMKYFFSSSLDTERSISSTAVKNLIKSIIDNETNILSDRELVLSLEKKGINISRRTISKYRESLGIASSAKREKEKKFLDIDT